jgi:hypothetical protein
VFGCCTRPEVWNVKTITSLMAYKYSSYMTGKMENLFSLMTTDNRGVCSHRKD